MTADAGSGPRELDQGGDADVIACDVSAIPTEDRNGHFSLARALFREALAVRELATGVEFELSSRDLARVTTFLENERRCCQHLAFTLQIPPRQANITLRVDGPGAREEMLGLFA